MLRSHFLSLLAIVSLSLVIVGCDQAAIEEGASLESGAEGTAKKTAELGLAKSPWPRFHRDLKNSGRSEQAGPSTPEISWTFEPGDGGIGVPSVGPDGTVYVGTGGNEGRVYALGPDGSLNWSL